MPDLLAGRPYPEIPTKPLTDKHLTELVRIYEEDEDTGEIIHSLPNLVAEIREFRLLKSALKFLNSQDLSIGDLGLGGNLWVCDCKPKKILAAAKAQGWKPK